MNKNDNLLKTEAEIRNWLNEMNIDEYIIHDDLTVDINQNVYLIGKKLTHLPIKLGIVNGDFNIYKNYLTSLENFPHTVVGDLDCSENAIDSLMNSPVKKVGETFNCSENYISNLKGMPNSLNNID